MDFQTLQYARFKKNATEDSTISGSIETPPQLQSKISNYKHCRKRACHQQTHRESKKLLLDAEQPRPYTSLGNTAPVFFFLILWQSTIFRGVQYTVLRGRSMRFP